MDNLEHITIQDIKNYLDKHKYVSEYLLERLISCNNLEIVKYICESNSISKLTKRRLLYMRTQNEQMIEYFIKNYKFDNRIYNNAIIKAAVKGNINILKLLNENRPGAFYNFKWTLSSAMYYKHYNIISYLIENAPKHYRCKRCLIKSTCTKLCEHYAYGK